MNPPNPDPESAADLGAGHDPELEAALKRVLEVIYKDHPLNPNQILVLSSELQRIGVHRLVEEHLRKYRHRQEAIDS
jgi:hypothetical protein